jgi:response regulator RpfG family c-di-GMP phosphodiesterase
MAGLAGAMTARILLVEDNPQTRKLFRVTLESQGCEVLEATDGHGAVALAEGGRCPDLIIQDLLLPDMDGIELAGRLRACPGCERVPIIAVSGFAQRMFGEEADAIGFADRLLKPVEPSQLLEIVRPFITLPTAAAAAAKGAGESPGGRVLIADDDPVQRKLTRLRLRDAGFDVIEAADGVAAVELARSWRPDAVVTDVLMPRMDGFDVCRRLRADPDLKDVRIVLASSAFVDEQDRELALRAGADEYVVRAPDLSAIVEALQAALSHTGAPAAAAEIDRYDELHRERLAEVAAAKGAESAQLAGQAETQRAQLMVFAGISEALGRSASAETALGEVLARCLEATGLAGAAIHLLDRDSGRLVPRAVAGVRPRISTDRLQQVVLTGRPARTEAAIAAPLRQGDDALGVVAMCGDRGIDDERAAMVSALAAQIGQAVALARAQAELVRSREQTIIRLVRAIELRDSAVAEHTRRMSGLCALMADLRGFEHSAREQLRVASLMHDIGKVAIPDAILLSPDPLTEDDFEVVKRHTEIGFELLSGSGSPLLDLAATIALTHHERWDGTGYPRGLRADEIPIEGRIAAIADVFDALTSDRVYRPRMQVRRAVAIMIEGRGSHFDPALLDQFVASLDAVVAIGERSEAGRS